MKTQSKDTRINTRRMRVGLIGLSAGILGLSTLAFPDTASAAYKCWTNRDGVKECGERVPPEYSQQGHETRNTEGMTIDRQGAAPDKAELARLRAEEAARVEEQKRREREQRARAISDDALLATYTTEADVLRARDNHIEGLKSRLKHAGKVVLPDLNTKRYTLEEGAATFERDGEEIPSDHLARLERNARQIGDSERSIEDMRDELEDLTQRFTKELARFRELKGTTSSGGSSN